MPHEDAVSRYRCGASAKSIPVVSDVTRERLVGVAYWAEGGDILIVVKDEEYKNEVGAYFDVDGLGQFMLGCQYIPAKKHQASDMYVRKMLIDFSNNPRVLVDNRENPNDGRKGRVTEIRKSDAKIRVCFESGPGDLVAWFDRYELQIIRDNVDIRVVD